MQKAGEALLQKIDDLYANFATPPSEALGLGDAGPPLVERPTPYPNRMLMLYGQVANYSAPPTAWQREQATLLAAKADELVAAVRGVGETDLAVAQQADERIGRSAHQSASSGRRSPEALTAFAVGRGRGRRPRPSRPGVPPVVVRGSA